MDAPLKQRLLSDMKEALRSRDKLRLNSIRMMLAAIKQIEVDERIELDDGRVVQILDKMIKQRRDAIAQYTTANRDDLVVQERFEENLIREYLPKALSESELQKLISETIEHIGGTSIKDMGKVMAKLKLTCLGRVDAAALAKKVKERLS